MESQILDKKEVKEAYEYNGNKKTRVHTIRSMINGTSEFINYRCGKSSVNISKNILPAITENMNNLTWEKTNTNTETETVNTDSNEILKALQQIGKNQQKLNTRLSKLEKGK